MYSVQWEPIFVKATFMSGIYAYEYVNARKRIHQNVAVIISEWIMGFQMLLVDWSFPIFI